MTWRVFDLAICVWSHCGAAATWPDAGDEWTIFTTWLHTCYRTPPKCLRLLYRNVEKMIRVVRVYAALAPIHRISTPLRPVYIVSYFLHLDLSPSSPAISVGAPPTPSSLPSPTSPNFVMLLLFQNLLRELSETSPQRRCIVSPPLPYAPKLFVVLVGIICLDVCFAVWSQKCTTPHLSDAN